MPQNGHPSFGRSMWKEGFLLQSENVNVNHGSFGAVPRQVLEEQRRLQTQTEGNPDVFYRYRAPVLIDRSRALLAELVRAPHVDDVVLIPNATTGVNTILRNLVFRPGETIVYFSTAYGSCEKTIDYITEITPAKSHRIDIEYPISDDELVSCFTQVLQDHAPVRVAMFDLITSLPGVRVPFERLVAACRTAGVLSLVDGAHGVGCIPLDLTELDPDFLVSNCHKWLYAPRGCAMMYVPRRNQHLITSSLPTSHAYVPIERPGKAHINNPLPPSEKPAFVQLFEFVGTIDVTPYLCVPAALEFRDRVCGGEEAIMKYCDEIAREGGRRVAEILGTEVMSQSQPCCMVNVRLPLESPYATKGDDVSAQARVNSIIADIGGRMVQRHGTFVATCFHADHFWARLCGQIYLILHDFDCVGRQLREVCGIIQARSTVLRESTTTVAEMV